MIRGFRDTWELGIHSYLTYLRDRLRLALEPLHESGSCFVQISKENLHHVREVMDEVFAPLNFVYIIYFATTGGFATGALSRVGDYLLWYRRDRSRLKYRGLYTEKELREGGGWAHSRAELEDGTRRPSASRKRDDYSPKGAKSARIPSTGWDPRDCPQQVASRSSLRAANINCLRTLTGNQIPRD